MWDPERVAARRRKAGRSRKICACSPPVNLHDNQSDMNLEIPVASSFHLLVLIGGGEFSFGETREIDEYLVRAMPADRRTVAFIPVASGSAEYATHLGAYFKQIDPSIETINVPIYRPRDARRRK